MLDIWTLDIRSLFPAHGQGIDPLDVSLKLLRHLSTAEQERAESFPSVYERVRYAAARYLLRSVLSDYTGRPAGELEFGAGPGGKPFLREPRPGLSGKILFNISHSGDAVAAAVADREVGIDIERHRRVRDLDRLIEYAFSSAEADVLLALPRTERIRVFFQVWCLKEAVVKAWGVKAAEYLDRFAVIGTGADGTGITYKDSLIREGRSYRTAVLNIFQGYVSAVCVETEKVPEIRIIPYRLEDSGEL